MVLTSSSGCAGEPPNVPAGIVSASYCGYFAAIASAESISRKVAVPPLRIDAANASAVMRLLTGPAAIMASTFCVRTASATSLVPNCTISTLAGSTAYWFRMTFSRLTLACVRPITPTRWPASWLILVILAAFLPFGGRRHPQHHDVLAQRRNGLRVLRHVEVAADDGEISLAFGERGGARDRAVGRHDAQPGVAALAQQRLRQRVDHLHVVRRCRTDRDPQRRRPQHVIDDADGTGDDRENAGDQREIEPHAPRAARTRRSRPVRQRAAKRSWYVPSIGPG